MSFATIAEFGADWIDLDRPLSGEWILRAKLDIGTNNAPMIGPSQCIFNDGNSSITYEGTIITSSDDNGDAYVVMVGGAGKLSTVIDGDDYSRPQVRTVFAAIIGEIGETIGNIDGLDSLARIDPVYTRARNQANRQLDALCDIVGARWFVRNDGKIEAGPLTWPTYAGDPFIIHNANSNGIIIADPALPDIVPGMIVDGVRIGRVRYFVDSKGLSTHLYKAEA